MNQLMTMILLLANAGAVVWMAEAGYTAEQILNFFYKGSMIVSASD